MDVSPAIEIGYVDQSKQQIDKKVFCYTKLKGKSILGWKTRHCVDCRN